MATFGSVGVGGAVVVLGSLNMDLVVRAPVLPRPGETVLGGPLRTYHGGKGANQAVAAARAGSAVRMIGAVGDDAYGLALRAALVADHIDDRHVATRTGEGSGVAVITVDDRAENSIVVVPGTNGSVSAAQVDAAFAAGADTGATVFLAQLEVPLATVAHGLRVARAAGLITVLNAAPAPAATDIPADLFVNTDVLIVNETEHDALRARVAHVGRVVLTLGSRGARCGDFLVAGHRINAVDTTGAGDAFCGAFAAALACGVPLLDAMRWGNAAGALAATKAGAQSSLPGAAEIAALVASAR